MKLINFIKKLDAKTDGKFITIGIIVNSILIIICFLIVWLL